MTRGVSSKCVMGDGNEANWRGLCPECNVSLSNSGSRFELDPAGLHLIAWAARRARKIALAQQQPSPPTAA